MRAKGTKMAKWIGYLGGGAAGAAVAIAGYVVMTLYGDPETPRETPAALITPEPANTPKPESDAAQDEAQDSGPAPVVESVDSDPAPEAEPAKKPDRDPAPEAELAELPDSDPVPEAELTEVPDNGPAPEAESAEMPDDEPTPEAEIAELPEEEPAPVAAPEPAPDAGAAPENAGAIASDPDPAPDAERAEAPEAVPEAETAELPDSDPTPDPATAEPTPPEPEPVDKAAPPLVPPTFDLVRIEPDGSAIVAGEGAARAPVRIFLDGGEIGETTSGSDGRFVSLLRIPPSRQPRLMTLATGLADTEVFSKTEIIVAPFGAVDKAAPDEAAPAPEAVAEKTPVESEPRDRAALPDAEGAETAADAEIAPAGDIAEVVEPQPAGSDGGAAADAGETPSAEVVAERPVAGAADESPEPERTTEAVAALDVPEGAAASPEQIDPPVQTPAAPEPVATAAVTEPAPDEADPAVPDRPAAVDTSAPASAGADRSEDIAAADTSEPPAGVGAAPVLVAPAPAATAADPVAEVAATVSRDTDPLRAVPEAVEIPAAPEPETPPTLLASDNEGVRVLTGPEVLDRVAIDTISYDNAGDVALAGRGTGGEAGGFVRVYLDNTPITTSRVRADGSWRVTLPRVDKGVYTLRVDEVDGAGEVTSRAETPFLREDREALDKASNATEGDGPVRIVTVQPGNTLWQIARDRYGEGILYVRVFDANRGQIRDPDLIYPGQVFDLPAEEAAE